MLTLKESSLRWQQHQRRCCILVKAAFLSGLILVTTLTARNMWSQQDQKMASRSEEQGSGEVLVDYRGVDYRGFLFVVHDIHGLMLLRCTRKKNKGPHWQVPGGHIDEPEFLAAGTKRKLRRNRKISWSSRAACMCDLHFPPTLLVSCSS
jgi:hypothetical protein